MEPDGDLRWRIRTPAPIQGDARWSPDGYRIAYVTATGWLHVVAGDGSGDRPLARAQPIAPEWRPGAAHTIAYVTRSGRVEVRDADTWRPIFRSPRAVPRGSSTVTWTADGSRVAAVSTRTVRIFELRGASVAHTTPPRPGGRILAAAYAPAGGRLALIGHRDGSSRVTIGGRTLFTVAGSLRGLAWSPDGGWLLVGMPATGQWIAVRTRGAPRLATLDGRGAAPQAWCCAASAVFGRATPTRR